MGVIWIGLDLLLGMRHASLDSCGAVPLLACVMLDHAFFHVDSALRNLLQTHSVLGILLVLNSLRAVLSTCLVATFSLVPVCIVRCRFQVVSLIRQRRLV